jgi:hypothetical protein
MKDLPNPLNQNFNNKYIIKNTDDIINIIKRNEVNHIYLLVHPHQWRDNLKDWIKFSILKQIRYSGKKMLKTNYKNKKMVKKH